MMRDKNNGMSASDQSTEGFKQLDGFSWNTYSEDTVAKNLGGNPTVPVFRTDTCPIENIRELVEHRGG